MLVEDFYNRWWRRTVWDFQPVTDVTSNDIICNTGFVQPVSTVVANVPAGGNVTAQFHHTSAGYVGPDPSDPLDPTNKGEIQLEYATESRWYDLLGPILAYL